MEGASYESLAGVKFNKIYLFRTHLLMSLSLWCSVTFQFQLPVNYINILVNMLLCYQKNENFHKFNFSIISNNQYQAKNNFILS